ncbi:MAG TPA: serine/threonine-protein kinase [Polyangiaceae bacterium]|nr:serine/threonine-protein kinase [Polyangiaceae bacterium]
MSETVALTQGLPSHIRPGLVIGGKYRLEQEIGKGSMGTVYRAVHVTLGQRVAIKLISGEHSQSLEARKRFSVEAKAAAKLRSRHVVQVYDDGETPEGNPYIVLEYLEGETLEQRLEREHDLPLADAVRVVSHVGRALARAHAQGIVHRDLKPANIFLVKTDDDELGWLAKVLDFGIAKLESGEQGTTQAGTVLGTPLFMSPEQVRGASSVDHRADLYSLGMCLYHMMTADFAFYAANYSDILIGICTRPLPLLREKAPWVPEAVEQWFQRACAREPLERFQSADEMTEALVAAAGTAPPLAKHKSFPEGRIAPETLSGYAAPPASMSRTQLVMQPAFQAPAQAPIASSIGGDATSTNPDWSLPKRKLSPLLVGAGLGFLAVVVLGVALVALGAGNSKKPELAGVVAATSSIAFPSASPAPPATQAPASTTPPVTAQPASGEPIAPAHSSVTDARGKQKPRPAPPPAAPVPRPAPPRTSGSDLGF